MGSILVAKPCAYTYKWDMCSEVKLNPGTDEAVYLGLALSEALKYVGSTAPNPPVGATLAGADGRVLAVSAHKKAGTPHAEVHAISEALQNHGPEALRGATMFVTLEPCNHRGRTPPCTQAIINAGITCVAISVRDPNPRAGGGLEELERHGIKIKQGILENEGRRLIAPFEKWIKTSLPYIVHKQAWRLDHRGQPTMIPLPGVKTFTDQSALIKAHELRRQSDAIITGMGTVLADQPLLNVRHIPDHPDKRRLLAVIGESDRTPASGWLEWKHRQETSLGFEVHLFDELGTALKELGKHGVLQALIEAGPRLSQKAREEGIWDQRILFFSGPGAPVVEEFAYVHRNH